MSDTDLEGYFDGLAEGELRGPFCGPCDGPWWPPRPVCPRCGADPVEWRSFPRVAELHTWTVVGRSTLPAFQDAVPYAVGVFEFADEGVRVVGHVESAPELLEVGAPMTWAVREEAVDGPQVRWRVLEGTEERE